METQILIYDWRETVDWKRVNALIKDMAKPHFTEIDDGSDSHVVVITDGKVTKRQAETLYKKEMQACRS